MLSSYEAQLILTPKKHFVKFAETIQKGAGYQCLLHSKTHLLHSKTSAPTSHPYLCAICQGPHVIVSNCIAPSSEHSGNKALPQWLGRVSQGLSKTGSLSNTSVLSTAIPPSACPWRPFLGLTQAPVRSPALYPPGTIPQLITTIANFLFPSRHPSYSYSPSPPPPLHYVLKRL